MGSALIGRRSFLAGILGAAAAPAIVKAESLMKIIVPQQRLYTGELGAIDAEFRFVATHPGEQWLADAMTRDMLKHFKTSRPIAGFPLSAGATRTIKFRRCAGPILVPSSPLHDLLNGDRKAS